MKVYVFVGMFGGLIDKVETYTSEKEAIAAWETYTANDWEKFKNSNYDYSCLHEKLEGTNIFESKIQEPIHDKKYCSWTIKDPMSMYPEMTEDQAVTVMNLVERQADYDIGVNYSSIRNAVGWLFPDMESADEINDDDEEVDIL